MPPDMNENDINHLAKLFRLGREARRPGDPLIVTGETTAWEIYNYKASEVDREMIKDWNDSLNTLLIFTALYSAVLTAFIIESMKLLQENPAETTRDILVIVSRQLANSSFPPFEPTAYQTPQYAIVVNGLFFISLSCALIAALLAVLALQWVASYDMGLSTSSPEKRALQRHIRFRGIEKWKMSELIASLPLLIFVALFLFFIGIADWLWHVNRAISGIVIGGIGIGFLLYTITNLISIINLDAPFRTPISKEFVVLVPRVAEWLLQAITNLSSTAHRRDMSYKDAKHTMDQQITFTKHEEGMLDRKGNGEVTLDGLVWLANHIEISSASHEAFITLIKGLTKVPAKSLMDEERIKGAPWKAIFEILCSTYIGKDEYSAEELEMAMWICKGMGIIPYFESHTFEQFFGILRNSRDPFIYSMAQFARYKQKDKSAPFWEWEFQVRMGSAFEHTNGAISQIGYNYLHFMLLSAKREWPDMKTWEHADLAESMADAWTIPSAVIRGGSSSIALPMDSIELILNLVIPRVDVDTIDARYLAAIPGEAIWDRQWKDALCRVLRMLTQHLILQISQKYDCVSAFTKELELFSSFMAATRLNLAQERDSFICVMVDKLTGEDEFEKERILGILCSGLYSRPFRVAWIDLILAMDDFVTRMGSHSFPIYSKFIWYIDCLYEPRVQLDGGANLNLLAQVRDPCIAWIASWRCPSDVQVQGLICPNFSEWGAIIEGMFIHVFGYYPFPHTIVHSDARITFLRALILDGPSNARIAVLRVLYRHAWLRSDGEKWHQLFASPVLSAVLEQSAKSEGFSIRSLLREMASFRWFYEEFSHANGLDWLPLLALNALHLMDRAFENNEGAILLLPLFTIYWSNIDSLQWCIT
ncbi:hypothetical protein CPB86DRAFT_811182 [Serendipita vermifera]|nr:hypothetical protein CPB86DRAFT_811182 [Serendipita vermifera]